MALPTALVQGLDLQNVSRELNDDSPSQYDSLEAKRITEHWGKWLGRQQQDLQLYDLRHAWAVRSIRESVPMGLAARCMGHDIGVHTRTYHRWLTEAVVATFVASRAWANHWGLVSSRKAGCCVEPCRQRPIPSSATRRSPSLAVSTHWP